MQKFKKLIVFLLVFIGIVGFSYIDKKDELTVVEAEVENQRMLKAVWVSPFVSDVASINTEVGFKNRLNGVLDTLESYGYNALIFHVRTHNNALYPSNINPKSPYVSNIDFNSFDPLEWLVEETHKRGIEFHAWLNPYRLAETRIVGSMPYSNPESNPGNILTDNSGAQILDPANMNVKEHIVDTVGEIIENYDVDAIHFDDYFYRPYNGLTEAEKIGHVNDMIEMVSDKIKIHNLYNQKHVQFGISPTGIYKNGNGVVSYDPNFGVTSSGSNTTGQQHGRAYLCADTLYWMNQGWLDYIMPQIYWERGHSHADFETVLRWWDSVASYLDVNLYVGLGLYKVAEEDSNWGDDSYELSAQLTLIENYEFSKGYSMYSYRRFNSPVAAKVQMENAYDGHRSDRRNISVLPEIKSMTPVVPNNVSHNHSNSTLTWERSNDAKFYYLFRSTGTLTYSDDELFAVVGKDTLAYQTNDFYNQYNYGVKVLSPTNHLSGQSVDDPIHTTYSITYNLDGGIFEGYDTKEEIASAFLSDLYDFVEPNESKSDFIHGVGKTSGFDGLWYSNEDYRSKIYTAGVKKGNNGYFLSNSNYQEKWEPLADFMDNFVKVGNATQDFWSSPFTGNLRLKQYFTNTKPGGAWSDDDMGATPDGLSQVVPYVYDRNTSTINLPIPAKSNSTFLGWYDNPYFSGSAITSIPRGSTGDKVFYAKWDNVVGIYHTVYFSLGYSNQTLPSVEVLEGSSLNKPQNPTRSGYTFLGWYLNDSLYDFSNNITNDITLIAKWQDDSVPLEYVTLEFNLGYKGLSLDSLIILKGEVASRPTDPKRDGYMFLGWFVGSTNNEYNFNDAVNYDLTLTAKWIKIETYTITYVLNGGSFPEGIYKNRDEMILDFLTEFYEFLNLSISLNEFLHGSGKTEGYDGSYNEYIEDLRVLNNKNIIPNATTFVNKEEYNKWVPLLDLINEYVAFNPNQVNQFWGSNSTGMPRFKQFVRKENPWGNAADPLEVLEVVNRIPDAFSGGNVPLEYKTTDDDILLISPIKDDVAFLGWYDNSQFVGSKITVIKTSQARNITLYAKWDGDIDPGEIVIVRFDYGYDGLVEEKTVPLNGKVEKPTTPTRDGYIFVSWNLGYDEFDFNTNVTHNIILNANWRKISSEEDYVVVTFDHNYNGIKDVVNVIRGTNVTRPANPVRSGYKFLGWYFIDELYDFNTNLTYNINLIAKWEELADPNNYVTVKFDYDYDSLIEEVSILMNSKVNRPTNPVRSGYKFIGWNLGYDEFDFNINITHNITLIAQWQKVSVPIETVDVNFDLNYNGLTLPTERVEKGNKVVKPTNPKREGYVFVGWYFANELYDFNNTLNYSITLIAKWEIEKVVVKFNLGYSNKYLDSLTTNKGTKVLEPFTPYREGYLFSGWYNGNSKYNFNDKVISDITLKAHWQEIKALTDVSIYGKSETKINKEDARKALVFYGIIDELDVNREHGFYLIYGRTTILELKNAISTNNLIINDKKVFKVVVRGTINNGVYSVIVKGIPENHYDDVITVVPYLVKDGNEILGSEPQISSINHADKIKMSLSLITTLNIFDRKRFKVD